MRKCTKPVAMLTILLAITLSIPARVTVREKERGRGKAVVQAPILVQTVEGK